MAGGGLGQSFKLIDSVSHTAGPLQTTVTAGAVSDPWLCRGADCPAQTCSLDLQEHPTFSKHCLFLHPPQSERRYKGQRSHPRQRSVSRLRLGPYQGA